MSVTKNMHLELILKTYFKLEEAEKSNSKSSSLNLDLLQNIEISPRDENSDSKSFYILLNIIGFVFLAISIFQIKVLNLYYPEDLVANNVLFIRCACINDGYRIFYKIL